MPSANRLPSPEWIDALRTPTPERPLVVLLSGCLRGLACGYDGSSYGTWSLRDELAAAPNARLVAFCPEEFAFGTPRALCNIHGGDGFDVLAGRARVRTEEGEDWTDGMVRAAERTAAFARENGVELAVLMDMSAACGSQVISDGHRTVADRKYRRGVGVAAAALLRSGALVVSQRDFRTLEALRRKLDPAHAIDAAARDHHETEWYRAYFGDAERADEGV
jgi:uncharacterized protein YbbK (DUF523 family)